MNLQKIYGFFVIFRDLLDITLPVLEKMIKKDLNGNGEIGK